MVEEMDVIDFCLGRIEHLFRKADEVAKLYGANFIPKSIETAATAVVLQGELIAYEGPGNFSVEQVGDEVFLTIKGSGWVRVETSTDDYIVVWENLMVAVGWLGDSSG